MISGAPFVSLFVTSFVWTMYGVLLPDPVLVPASVFGVAAGLLCCMSFHRVSEWPVSTQPAMQLITNTCRIVQIKSTTTHRQLQFLFRCVLAYHILYVSMCMNAFCDARQPTVLFCIIQLFTCAASPPPRLSGLITLSRSLAQNATPLSAATRTLYTSLYPGALVAVSMAILLANLGHVQWLGSTGAAIMVRSCVHVFCFCFMQCVAHCLS